MCRSLAWRGVSGGALVAAAWAGGADLEELVELGANLHPWMWVRGWGGGLLSGSRLGALIDEALPVARFDGLRIPLWFSRRTSTPARASYSGRVRSATSCALLQLSGRVPADDHERPSLLRRRSLAGRARGSGARDGGKRRDRRGSRLYERLSLAEGRLFRVPDVASRADAAAGTHARPSSRARTSRSVPSSANRPGCGRAGSRTSSRRVARRCATPCPSCGDSSRAEAAAERTRHPRSRAGVAARLERAPRQLERWIRATECARSSSWCRAAGSGS